MTNMLSHSIFDIVVGRNGSVPMKILRCLASLALAVSMAMAQPVKRVDDATLKNAGKSGDEWLTYGFTPGETRYSPLDQLNPGNVKRLGLAWSYDVGAGGGGKRLRPWSGKGPFTASPTGAVFSRES